MIELNNTLESFIHITSILEIYELLEYSEVMELVYIALAMHDYNSLCISFLNAIL